MKTLGIVGGIGPESTVEYYRTILRLHREASPDMPPPRIIINSIDVHKMLRLIGSGDREATVRYLRGAIETLTKAGADFALMAANTPHIVFEQLCAECTIPLLSIVDTVREHAEAIGCKRVGLLGTKFVMEAGFYAAALAKSGIIVVSPSAPERDYVHNKYVSELLSGTFLPATKAGLANVIGQMQTRERIDAVLLGGTELPLLFKEKEVQGVRLLDTTHIHAHAAVKLLLNERQTASAEGSF